VIPPLSGHSRDNTARYQDGPAIFVNTTPAAYQAWLEAALEDVCLTNSPSERLVFINAWNEWGEGTYLEPDKRFGFGFLEATKRALEAHRSATIVEMASSQELETASGHIATDLPDVAALGELGAAYRHNGIEYLEFLSLIDKILKPDSYLEIGTDSGNSLARFSCDAICIAPSCKIQVNAIGNRKRFYLYQMASDEYFAIHRPTDHFPAGVDVIYIDGLHLFENVLQDFINSERFCHHTSVILIHDCFPTNRRMAERTYRVGPPDEGPLFAAWTGDVWKIVFALKQSVRS
jgi:hypothetical protein